ncbi:thiol-disulfide isomerase/thioredoxin [Chryseobacterium rhizosphaerae]|uniref:TlpA family protein disulfide reductase n=1 Tax=Chryseobacterium rhizosphaerae TaxID=395937 RepID=UPI00285CA682|nr:TlpA disulfide reductase family protein [Chryseobacterium rhizosphaerae]MDR6544184.1 thiol-disulfide isomerase/thioredoxin [Chryseobacterium rhizosphaerae]
MKYRSFIFIITLFSLNFFSQDKLIVVGKDVKNEYEETLKLLIACNEKYYKGFNGDSSVIKNNIYNFSIPNYKDNIPRPFRFLFKTGKNKVFKVSDIFFLSKKMNNINFNSDNNKIIFDGKDNLHEEIINYETHMKSYTSKKSILDSIKFSINESKKFKLEKTTIDSLQNLYDELDQYEDSLLLNLSKKTSNSYVLFWKLVGKFESKGYKNVYDQIFNNLNTSVKKSSVGLIFDNQLKKSEKIALGSIFPDLIFDNRHIVAELGEKYTLIDFWFSYCQPCIEDFPKYREIYSKYHHRGFEIINISTDRTKDKDNWKRVIKEKELIWEHFLDENGMKAKQYNINKFPTNFLLDTSGRIIKKDITPEELEIYLNENLKQ